MSIDSSTFIRAMARVPGPVTIATTTDAAGRRWGFTGSSFSSLSLNPPLVLICLDKTASTHEAFSRADRFLINVLAQEQADVALRFARSGVDRFEAGDMVPCEFELPGLKDAAARVACTMHDILDGGDHTILVGRAEATYVGEERIPLIYSDRAFARPVTDQMAGAR
ncbi:flavin reductase family protein [Streptomyces sp. NPDC096191]|uniref:flavin reductase family protein n=1 Tax=Streptomyces sp. NPDC096191 TaxID=3155426 RepID=UPI003322505E